MNHDPALTFINEGPHLRLRGGLGLFPHGAVRFEARGAKRARLDAPDLALAERTVVWDVDKYFAALAICE